MLIHWKAAYETGVDSLDQDHRTLAELINSLGETLTDTRLAEAPDLMTRLVRLFEQHSAREEAVMRKSGFADADSHAASHRHDEAEIAALAERVRRSCSGPVVEAAVAYLGRWFFDHVVGQDLRLRDHYRKTGLAHAAHPSAAARLDALLGRFRVRSRILLAAAIPILLALCLGIALVAEKYTVHREMRTVTALTSYAVAIGNLVHELQIERGMTALSLAGDAKAQSGLTAQHGKADEQMAALLATPAGRQTAGLDAIERLRAGVRDRSLNTADAIEGYSAAIAGMMAGIGERAKHVGNGEVGTLLQAYLNLVKGKEQAGQERAIGAAGFADGFTDARFKRFLQRGAEQSAYFENYASLAGPERQAKLRDALQGAAMADYARQRDSAKLDQPGNTAEAARWFTLASQRLEVLKGLEADAAGDLLALAKRIGGASERALIELSAAAAIVVAAAILLTVAIVRSVTSPFHKLSDAIARIGGGDKDAEIAGTDRRDEIGDMARTMMQFRSALLANDSMGAQQALERAFNDARIRRREELTRSFDKTVSEIVEVLSSSSSELVATAQEMNRVAGDTTDRATTVAAASEQTSTNIQTVASAVEQLASSVREITRQVNQSARRSADAVEESQRTNVVVNGLADAAERIGQVVLLINDIASQTNLLALNATIEAARAGEAGKGFTVVANEVKHLAMQTVKATSEIGDQVEAIQSATASSVLAIRHIGETIREINGVATAIASAVEEQSAATQEIARNVQEAAKGVDDVNRNITVVSHGATQTIDAAGQVLQAADAVSNRSESMKSEVEGFLSEMRAA
jgi:hemerythrin-like metal-binding protein